MTNGHEYQHIRMKEVVSSDDEDIEEPPQFLRQQAGSRRHFETARLTDIVIASVNMLARNVTRPRTIAGLLSLVIISGLAITLWYGPIQNSLHAQASSESDVLASGSQPVLSSPQAGSLAIAQGSWLHKHLPHHGTTAKPTQKPHAIQKTSASIDTVLDILRAQPAVDLYQEYGLDPSSLLLYPEPLGKQIAIVNVDTREWNPWDTPVKNMDANHWGFFNHYMYAEMHGYTFIHSQVPKLKNRHNTWAKVSEQFRLTMQDRYKFVIVLDADTIFSDLRIPMEALLSHWNITSEIAIAGGQDLTRQVDQYGRVLLNTGFIISQRTAIFPALMRDWIDCPTEVKYKDCARWKRDWAHEQSVLSNYIRYEYPESIRELPLEEVHLGKFIRHYWGDEKGHVQEAALKAFLGNTLEKSLDRLAKTWLQYHQRVFPAMYKELLHPMESSQAGQIPGRDPSLGTEGPSILNDHKAQPQ